MVFNSLIAASAAVSVLGPTVSPFDAQAKTNVVTYYVCILYSGLETSMTLTNDRAKLPIKTG